MADYVGPSAELMEHAKHLWGTKGVFTLIRGNENWVYSLDGTDLIFRFTADYHRTQKELEGEMDFIHFLSEKRCRVVAPVTAKDGKLVHALSDVWFVTVFKKARGRALVEETDFTEEIFYNWGQTIGEMHKFIKTYKPSEERRNHWDTDDGFRLAEAMIPVLGKDHYSVNVFEKLVDEVRALPKTPASYALIHADIHQGNFFVDDSNQLVVFDFDDSMYHFYMFDLAVPMATVEMRFLQKKFATNLRRFQDTLLEGYSRHATLPAGAENDIELFVRYRMAHLYLWGASRIHFKRINDIPAVQSMMDTCQTYLRKFYEPPK